MPRYQPISNCREPTMRPPNRRQHPVPIPCDPSDRFPDVLRPAQRPSSRVVILNPNSIRPSPRPPFSEVHARASPAACFSVLHVAIISAQPTPHTRGCGLGDPAIQRTSAGAWVPDWERAIKGRSVGAGKIAWKRAGKRCAGWRSTAPRVTRSMLIVSTTGVGAAGPGHQIQATAVTSRDICSRKSRASAVLSRRRSRSESRSGRQCGSMTTSARVANIWNERRKELRGAGVDGVAECVWGNWTDRILLGSACRA